MSPATIPFPTEQVERAVPHIAGLLARVRLRLMLGGVGAVLLWVAALQILLLVLGALDTGIGRHVSGNFVALSSALVGVGLLVAAAVTLATPDALAIARRLDAHFGLGERVSTALEAVLTSAHPSAVLAALLRDAEHRVGAADASVVAPLWRRAVVTGLLALLLSASALAISSSIKPTHEPVAAPVETAGAMLPEALAEDIGVLAELISADAADNDYLAAIAKSLEQLAEEAAGGLDAAIVEQRLAALTEHTRLAYGSEPPAWLQQVSDLASLSEMLDARQQAAETASATNMQLGSLDNSGSGERSAQDMVDYPLPPPMPIGLPAFEEGQGAGGAGSIDRLAQDGAISAQPMPDLGQLGERPGQSQPMAGAPMGQSTDAGRGEGDLAGSGSQPLSPDGAFAMQDLDIADNVLLPSQPENTGNRIRIQMPTDTHATDVAEGGFGADGSSGPAAESPVHRDATHPDQRHTIGRYFARGF